MKAMQSTLTKPTEWGPRGPMVTLDMASRRKAPGLEARPGGEPSPGGGRLIIQEMQLIYVPMYRIRPKKDTGQVLHKGTASVCG